jgi:hypothetical protein
MQDCELVERFVDLRDAGNFGLPCLHRLLVSLHGGRKEVVETDDREFRHLYSIGKVQTAGFHRRDSLDFGHTDLGYNEGVLRELATVVQIYQHEINEIAFWENFPDLRWLSCHLLGSRSASCKVPSEFYKIFMNCGRKKAE